MVQEISGNSELRFADVVGRVFARHDFLVDREFGHGNLRTDLALRADQVLTLVEIKVYRSRLPSSMVISRGIDFLETCMSEYGANYGIIVINLRAEQLADVRTIATNMHIMNMRELLWLAGDDENLRSELLNIDRELASSLRDFDETPTGSPAYFDLSRFRTFSPEPPLKRRRKATPGADLCRRLREIPPGRRMFHPTWGVNQSAWRHFEDVCEEALRLLFDTEFNRWTRQKPVGESGRFDLMAKIVGLDVFCRTLIEDFRSRYLLFELKNYGAQIRPNLVHVTEKYLFPTALRSTAFIISPKGLSKEAYRASQGALREAGKLVLSLTVEDLCAMLHRLDEGDPPSLFLENKLDSYLRVLDR